MNIYIPKYALDFVLSAPHASADSVKNAIIEFGEELEIIDCADDVQGSKGFKISVITEDPTIIFDTCAQFGRIMSVKINEAAT
jgi:dihydroxyacetone kinase-like predicted kinase